MAMLLERGKAMARDLIQTKLDGKIVREARQVAAIRNVPITSYLSEILAPIVRRDLEDELRKAGWVKESAPPPEKPRKKGGDS